MKSIIEILHTGGYSCVIKNQTEIRTFTQRGVADLYDLYQSDPSFMKGASIADKVIGKGAAAMMVLGGIETVYADVISTSALTLLRDAGIDTTFAREVPHIINRDKTGWCPLEMACDKLKSVTEMYPVIRNFITNIRSKKNLSCILLACLLTGSALQAKAQNDTLKVSRNVNIGEVVVTGTRNETDIRHLPMTVSVVGRPQIEKRYEPSLLPILTEQVPGLFTTARGIMGYGVSGGAAGGMSLRGVGGSPTTGLLVLIDGHPQYMGLMGHPIADAYQSMLTERVEVLRGPASVLYGSNAMGGVINIVTRKQPEDGVNTDINISAGSYGTLQTEISNRVRKGRFSSVVTGSYNRTDGHRADMGFEQYGGYAKLGYDIVTNWKVWGDVNVTQYNASNPGLTTAPLIDNDSRITRGMTSFALENHYEKTSGALSFFYNWGRHKINDGYSPGKEPQKAHFNSKDKMLGVSWYQSATLFTGNRLTVGLDYQHFGGESWNRIVATGESKPGVDKQMDEFAGYVDFRQDISSWLSLDAGIRVDHHSHVGTEFIPQGGLAFHLPKRSELKAMVSEGYRNPTIRELYMFTPNPELSPEKLMNYELSYSQLLLDGAFSYSANLYYINGDNIIIAIPDENGRRQNMNTGKIENWGAEATVAYRINSTWNLSANYSWLHMKNPVVAAPEHKLFFGADFTKGRWSASTGLQYIKGLYTSVVEGKEKQENFILWNVRGNYRLCPHAQLFVKGENLLAQRYEINAGYPMPKATFMGGIHLNF
ncbi:TonB-dependent receptor [uncultured Bacteroides sp.]|uniref:TonB-dependent receptor domain-containing protein n=1 Tax=uncultured Bacteroides sp. TaxID=162156 RepID=UPI0025D52F81|nr:TonB-dependent receptor [uncultured Bacteroides sp.]